MTDNDIISKSSRGFRGGGSQNDGVGRGFSCRVAACCDRTFTFAELEHGVAMSVRKDENTIALAQFSSILTILPFDAKAASQYGLIRANLQQRGMLIGQMDMLIAAHAMSLNLILATNNIREFGRVEGLTVENWV